jgi:hypothetical protein
MKLFGKRNSGTVKAKSERDYREKDMSQIIDPYPPEKNPMPDFFRQIWAPVRAAVESAIDPILIAHRDFIFAQHLTLPLDF